MNTPFDLILRQSYLHIFSYVLVLVILFLALADACFISQLKKALRRDGERLRDGALDGTALAPMIHPVARLLLKGPIQARSPASLERQIDLAEAGLFVPLRARMALTRDLSTLMGLIATLLALVAAATDFARHGKPELLIGSVGTGCVATCIAAIGCALSLWNLSRLTRLRLAVACESEAMLDELSGASQPAEDGAVPIRHATPCDLSSPTVLPQECHVSL